MPFEKGVSGNPGGRPKNIDHVRLLARTHTTKAIETLAHYAGQRENAFAAIAASNSLLDRGWGKPITDADSREHINITIRKILEGGALTVVETVAPSDAAKVIEHDDAEVRQATTHNHRNGGDDDRSNSGD